MERKRNRLSGYDYSQDGYYFVTICVGDRDCILGKVEDEKVILSSDGEIIKNVFLQMPEHYSSLFIDDLILMPNHLHAVLVIESRDRAPAMSKDTKRDARCASPTNSNYGLLSKAIQAFKSITRKETGVVWQRSFYDHIIRTEKALLRIKEYIMNNPLKWALDVENKENPDKNIKKYYEEIIGEDPGNVI
jgi:putative transposase